MTQLTDQVLLAGREALVLSKVVEEQLEVGVEAKFPGAIGRQEAKDLHGAIGSRVQIPVVTSNVHGRDFVADGVDTADACKP